MESAMRHSRLCALASAIIVVGISADLSVAQQPATPALPANRNQDSVAAPTRPRRSRLLLASRTPNRRRLARTPSVFGDGWLAPVIQVDTGTSYIDANLLLAGGSGRLKVADQNKAIPVDRAFLHYSHFHGAADVRRSPGIAQAISSIDSGHVDRFTLGLEKTFLCEQASIEFRLPFTASADYASPDFSMNSGDIGNLSIILKKLWVETDTLAVSYGMGIVTPTGSNINGVLPTLTAEFTIENRAVDLVPFIGVIGAPTDRLFYHGFMQLDVPLGRNRIIVRNGGTSAAEMTDQGVFSFDMAAGYWFYQQQCCDGVTGMAGMIELHVNGSTNDADFVPFAGALPDFGMRATAIENTNLTLGLHAALANDSIVRLGMALPLSEQNQRFFSSELLFSLQRRY